MKVKDRPSIAETISFANMKFIVTVVSLLAILALAKATEESKDEPAFVQSMKKLYKGPPATSKFESRAVVTEWITQKLDHFDENEERTWQMVGGLTN